MGSGQSVRASHFQRPKRSPEPSERPSPEDYPDDDHHISISNKMVERLVEDATLAGGAAAAVAKATSATPPPDHKDKVYIDKLRALDETHSERCGLTIEDVNALAKRVELRTAGMLSVEPVCAECANRVIECYTLADPRGPVNCWDTVGDFSKCVQDTAARRLRARAGKEARESARLSRHVRHARRHALRDLAGPPADH